VSELVTQQGNSNVFKELIDRVWKRGISHKNGVGFYATPVMIIYRQLCVKSQNALTDAEIYSLVQTLEARRDLL